MTARSWFPTDYDFVPCPGATVDTTIFAPFAGATRTEQLADTMCVDEASIRPRLTVDVPRFLIGRFPVTYGCFIKWVFEASAILTDDQSAYWRDYDDRYESDPDCPAVSLTLHEAQAFAMSSGARLPFRLEWIAAASRQNPDHPEDEDIEKQMLASANWGYPDCVFLKPLCLRPVYDSVPSWCGVCDLLGNADEFTASGAQFSERTMRLGNAYERLCFASTMRCGLESPVRHPAYSHWIDPNLFLPNEPSTARPTKLCLRLARDFD